jgi:hypothetical protein
MTWLAVVVILGTSEGDRAASQAEGVARAKASSTFREATTLFKARRYAAAVVKFEEAYASRPSPVLFFNIGRCYEKLGETGKALRAYRQYLHDAPSASDARAVKTTIAKLERRLRKSGVQQLLVFADPTNAIIEVDGKVLGTSPASAELLHGTHELVAKAEGFEAQTQSFTLTGEGSLELSVTLVKASPPPPPPVVVEAPTDVPLEQTAALTPKAKSPEGEGPLDVTATSVAPKRPRSRVGTIVAASVAVAGLGAGVGLGLGAQDLAASVRVAPVGQAPAVEARANALAMGANISYGVAGAALVTAVVLFVLEGSR